MNVTLPELVESDGRHTLHYKLADILWRCRGSAAHAADGRGMAPSASTNRCLVRIEAQFAGRIGCDGHAADTGLLAMKGEVILCGRARGYARQSPYDQEQPQRMCGRRADGWIREELSTQTGILQIL